VCELNIQPAPLDLSTQHVSLFALPIGPLIRCQQIAIAHGAHKLFVGDIFDHPDRVRAAGSIRNLALSFPSCSHAPMIRPADAGHPVLEQLAFDLHVRTRRVLWPEEYRDQHGSWEVVSPELREWFRDRARQFAAGDMRVAPWVMGG